jgi:hypothetical protein
MHASLPNLASTPTEQDSKLTTPQMLTVRHRQCIRHEHLRPTHLSYKNRNKHTKCFLHSQQPDHSQPCSIPFIASLLCEATETLAPSHMLQVYLCCSTASRAYTELWCHVHTALQCASDNEAVLSGSYDVSQMQHVAAWPAQAHRTGQNTRHTDKYQPGASRRQAMLSTLPERYSLRTHVCDTCPAHNAMQAAYSMQTRLFHHPGHRQQSSQSPSKHRKPLTHRNTKCLALLSPNPLAYSYGCRQ